MFCGLICEKDVFLLLSLFRKLCLVATLQSFFLDFWRFLVSGIFSRTTVSCFSQNKMLTSYFPLWRKVRSGLVCNYTRELPILDFVMTLCLFKNKTPPFDSKQKMSRLPVMSNKRALTSSSSSSENCHDCPPAQVCTKSRCHCRLHRFISLFAQPNKVIRNSVASDLRQHASPKV